jgi:hypothetical protein
MNNVHIPAPHNRFGFLQPDDILPYIQIPLGRSKPMPNTPCSSIRYVIRNQVESAVFSSDDATLLVIFLLADAIGYVQRLCLG